MCMVNGFTNYTNHNVVPKIELTAADLITRRELIQHITRNLRLQEKHDDAAKCF